MPTISIYYIALLDSWFHHLLLPWEIWSRIKCVNGCFEGFKAENLSFIIKKMRFHYIAPLNSWFGYLVSSYQIWIRINCLAGRFWGFKGRKLLIYDDYAQFLLHYSVENSVKTEFLWKETSIPPKPPEGWRSRPNFYEKRVVFPLSHPKGCSQDQIFMKRD